MQTKKRLIVVRKQKCKNDFTKHSLKTITTSTNKGKEAVLAGNLQYF